MDQPLEVLIVCSSQTQEIWYRAPLLASWLCVNCPRIMRVTDREEAEDLSWIRDLLQPPELDTRP